MLQKSILPVSWGLGLSEEQHARLTACFGEEHSISCWNSNDIPPLHSLEEESPSLLWLSTQGRKALHSLPIATRRHLELVPKVLLLDDQYSLQDYEEASDSGITEIVRPPFTKKRMQSIVRKALEVQSVHHDMLCMTREIMLERELLERKNEILSFLVNFLTSTSRSLDMESILQTAFQGLQRLFPARSMHAALWHKQADGTSQVELHIAAQENSASFTRWQETLLEQARQHTGEKFSLNEVHTLVIPHSDFGNEDLLPGDATLLNLPIMVGSEHYGVLLLLTDIERNLGRDQALALESAMTHLGLTIKNAKQFSKMQHHADYDALTQVHSRRHCEARLDEAMDCFNRYRQPLAVLMLDVDHFKRVNDTYGHQTGDIVLQEVAGIIQQIIRTSDYCARYGGEEFIILLPHTNENQAFALAERLRTSIEEHEFAKNKACFHISVSLGVACLDTQKHADKKVLLQSADAALYAAKASGRNCTRQSGAICEGKRLVG